ncbi:MAG: hypothetical protein D6758_03950 [Gammaproteobacteria bacterium]|nr:MAG: hypothetical protein D6758_03950 [Gammaproteobacteria bacterium]
MAAASPSDLAERVRHALGMPEDHPRLDELNAWAARWHNTLDIHPSRGIWSQLDDTARSELIDAISVPESFFWRYAAQLQRVVSRVHQYTGAGKVRIWSACCAGGEEPYTLAIMLAEAGLLEKAELVATDINARKLAQARIGRFSERAVRPLPAPSTCRWFDWQGGLHPWQIHDRLREAIRFEKLDLLAFAHGQVPPPLQAPHVVLCRNALIYFDKHSQRRIVEAFYRTSDAQAWLLLGHSERLPLTQTQWQLHTASDHAWYAKKTASSPEPPRPSTRLPEPARTDRVVPRPSVSPETHSIRQVRAVHATKKGTETSLTESLKQARSASEPHAIIQACRRALYLDPDCAEAHWLMIQAAHASGQIPLRDRHRRLLQHILASLPERTMINMETPVSVADLRRALDTLEGNTP